eukprot:gnl/MRDRNA2_/MRDRNA2_107998_c0_seq1.p1 gnl/MRDRNA2_/MRDRNA2_107998_c0~~gnl/MRDRNA2_/MRDRNA2_107998_c0_seq1.p1  ORF type:complete len:440 (+),score=118.22 gnl/MRDRNA2_/MRDRNA2_107998_c0_seq1:125-1444(+)
MQLALVLFLLSAGQHGRALQVATKQGVAACGTDPHEFTPLLKEVGEAKDRLSSAEAKVKAILQEAAKKENALEALEIKRENLAQKAAIESRSLANEMGELEALRQQTAELRNRIRHERYYLDRSVRKLDSEKSFLRTRRQHLNEESHRLKDMQLENARLHNSVDSWDYYRMRQEDTKLRNVQRRHAKEMAVVEQQAQSLERSTGKLHANMQHLREDQEDLNTAEVKLGAKQRHVLGRQSRLEKLEQELGQLESQVNRNIQLNNEIGKKVKQARANWAQASREAVDKHSTTLDTVHAEFQDRDRLAAERHAAIQSLAGDLKGTKGVLKDVKAELGARDVSIESLRGAIKSTQDQLKECQDKRLPEHLADDIEELDQSLPKDAAPSEAERFMAGMGDLAQNVADSSEPEPPSDTETPSDSGMDEPLIDKIGKLAELLKPSE